MKKLLLLAGLLVCLVLTPLTEAAHADTISSFTLSGDVDRYTAYGTFTVDITTGVVQSIDFNFSGTTAPKNPFSLSDVSVATSLGFTELFSSYGSGGITTFSSLIIRIPVTTFVGYTGGSICSIANPCVGNSTAFPVKQTFVFQNGQLTTTVTPEPSSISYLLLSLALLGSLPFLRRRVLQSCA